MSRFRIKQFVSYIFGSVITPMLAVGIFAIAVVLAYAQSVSFDGYPYDGPFQHLYPLREIDAGFRPGVDFQFFHGTAIPWINYPVYRLAGGGIFGAMFSAKVTQLVSVFGGLLFLCLRLFPAEFRMLAFFILFAVSASTTYIIGLAPLWDVSSFGIRTLAGLVVAGILASPPRSYFASLCCLALTAALGVYLGTEQGFYIAAAVFAAILVVGPIGKVPLRAIQAVVFAVLFIAATIGLSLAFFGSLAPLKFIKNVADDQVWYYGAPPVLFIRRLADLFVHPQWGFLWKVLAVTPVMALLLVCTAWKGWMDDNRLRACVFLLVWGCCGLTSDFSIVAYHYTEPLLRSAMTVTLLLAALGTQAWAGTAAFPVEPRVHPTEPSQ
jgi:hypothetical protein